MFTKSPLSLGSQFDYICFDVQCNLKIKLQQLSCVYYDSTHFAYYYSKELITTVGLPHGDLLTERKMLR